MELQRAAYTQFIAPVLLVYGVLFIYPALSAFRLSLTDWDGISNHYNVIGLENYKEAIVAPEVLTASWRNTLNFITDRPGLGLDFTPDDFPE
ncbi:MAG: sugar ABC transporter permease [SAR324 cluster bacterium]|nr:sugar ABC transporter permease [SAR324 cluster bacterium]